MLNRKLIFVVFLVATAFSFSGCGTQYTGTYQGQETVTQQGTTQNYAVTMQLAQSGQSVTGSYTSASGMTGTITGTSSGNTLTGVTLTMTGGTTAYTGSSIYGGSGYNCNMSYQAPVMTFNNNQLSGTFSINNTTTSLTTSYCGSTLLATSRQVVANKTN